MYALDSLEGNVLRYRIFRFQHDICLSEIAHTTGISAQRINQLELLEKPITPHARMLLRGALEAVIEQRLKDLTNLTHEYHAQQSQLFDIVKEQADESV